MPLYTVSHSTPLTVSQKDALADAITTLHATTFTTPRLFVNVNFLDISDVTSYVGGKPRRGLDNHIQANVRDGPGRSREDWNGLCRGIEKVWNEVVGKGLPRVRRAEGQAQEAAKGKAAEGVASLELRTMIVLGGLLTGLEAGFLLPEAGGDVEWLEQNWEAFKQKAGEGDEDFVDLVKEVEERGLLKGKTMTEAESDKAKARKLEELMGWGDD